MSQATPVPLIVVSATRDPVDRLNGVLRQAGIAVRCNWVKDLQEVGDMVAQLAPELLIACMPAAGEVQALAGIRDRVAEPVPILVVRDTLDEAMMATDLAAGAADTTTFGHPDRLQVVVGRALRLRSLERLLHQTLRDSQHYRSQLEMVRQRSDDAIALVHDGILVSANASWLELFGIQDASAVVGHPVMDLFDESAHASLKAALTACAQGQWKDHTLRTEGRLADGGLVPFDLALARGDFEGESCVQLIVDAGKGDAHALERDLEEAAQRDPSTGWLARRHLLNSIQARLKIPVSAGQRYVVCIRPDGFGTIERELGMLPSEQFLTALTSLIRPMLAPNDLAGRLGGDRLLLLLERGNLRDLEAWCENVVSRISHNEFRFDGTTIKATCAIGVSVVGAGANELNALCQQALAALRVGRERGGNQTVIFESADADARVQSYDEVWVRHINAALQDNRFRLLQLPVASLSGSAQNIFDIVVRMLDNNRKEILPSEFMPAAARNQLMPAIDRWIINAALALVVANSPDLLFVRVSGDLWLDARFPEWLQHGLEATGADPRRLCLQVEERVASANVEQVAKTATAVRDLNVRFALEHFGSSARCDQLFERIPMDFIKIDGALMQGLASNAAVQRRVREVVLAASKRNVQTVAERVEDANTMAVVWQLGVQFIQGYLVNVPEEVVLQS